VSDSPQTTNHPRLPRVANACALLTATIGLLAAAGWLLDIPVLKHVLPGLVDMKFNTALGLTLAAAGLWWRDRGAVRVSLGALVALLGAASLAESLGGIDVGLAELFLRDSALPPEASVVSRGMAPPSALCVLLLGVSLSFARKTGRQFGASALSGTLGQSSELLALTATITGVMSLVGYATGADYLRQLPGSAGMALNSSVGFVLLGIGVISAAEGLIVRSMRFHGSGRTLWMGFGVLTLLSAAIGVVFAVNIQKLEEDIYAQADVARPRKELTLALENDALAYELNVRLALAGDVQAGETANDRALDLDDHLGAYSALPMSAHQRTLAARLKAEWNTVQTLGESLLGANAGAGPDPVARFAAASSRLIRLLGEDIRADAVRTFEARRAITWNDLHRADDLPLELLVAGVLLALLTSGAVARTVLRQEQMVREQREWLRVTLSSIGDAVVACDTEAQVTFINPVAEALTGWRSEEALAQPIARVVRLTHDKDRGTVDIAARVLSEGRTVGLANHAQLVTRDGQEIPIEDSAAPITDSLGNLAGAVLVFHDVTQRRRAVAQLTESEARLRRAQEMAHLGSWEYDHVNGRLTWSDEVYRMFGWEPQEFEANHKVLLEGVHPDDRAAVEAAYSACVREGKDYEIEHRIVQNRTGAIRFVHERCGHRCDASGRVVASVGMVHDITERKQAEAELTSVNLRLALADRRKNDFLAVLSHELRNPLTPIANSLHILDRTAPGCEQSKRALQVIGRQVSHLSDLVNDLLDVTRITRNKIRLRKEPMDLWEVVSRSVEDSRSLFDAAGVGLELDRPSQPIPVVPDRTRVVQMVSNLLQNAAKFTHQGGHARVSVDVEGTEGVVRVADDGIGMDPKTLGRLFEPFVQVDQSLDRGKGGLGLGLALVKGLAQLHGGSVSVHSDGLGKGTEFCVRLSLHTGDARQSSAPTADLPPVRRRVLVIEDHVDAAETLREVLQLGGHEVTLAHSGPEGLAKAREFRPEVVLCDIGLPGMDGYEVACAFRSDEQLRQTYLVALTGYVLAEDRQRSAEAGFDLHLAKPLDLDELDRVLAELPAAGARRAGATTE
jgi:PAS domain S-box-containing protein